MTDMDKIRERLAKGEFTEEQIKYLLKIKKLLEDFLLWEKNRQEAKIKSKQPQN